MHVRNSADARGKVSTNLALFRPEIYEQLQRPKRVGWAARVCLARECDWCK